MRKLTHCKGTLPSRLVHESTRGSVNLINILSTLFGKQDGPGVSPYSLFFPKFKKRALFFTEVPVNQ